MNMKRFFAPLLASVLILTACNMETVFKYTNMVEFVTVSGNTLINDVGTIYTVTADETDHGWQVEGSRQYMLFDIEDRYLDVTVKKYIRANISEPVEYAEVTDPVDPVELFAGSFSGGYLNLELRYTRQRGSNSAHSIQMMYKEDAGGVQLFLVHRGNHENSLYVDEEMLITESAVYCFPVSMLPGGVATTYSVTYDVLSKNQEGQPAMVSVTENLYRPYGI